MLGTAWLPGQGSFNDPTWSLSAEIIGYVYFPALAHRLNKAGRFWTLILVAAVSLALLFGLQWLRGALNANDTAPGAVISRMGCCFIAGAALARARMVAPASVGRHAAATSMTAVAVILVSLLIAKTTVLLPAGFAVLIFALSYEAGLVDRLCRSRPIMFLGQVSFSLYLIHTQVLAWMEVHQPSSRPDWPVGLAMLIGYGVAVTLLSWALYVWVERPIHRMARAWTARVEPTTA